MEEEGALLSARSSYRQIGTNKGPFPKAKAPEAQPGPQPVRIPPSIPSKYYGTVVVKEKEKAGFGSRDQRFVHSENFLPGPGSHHRNISHAGNLKKNPSLSKQGYGEGFISKVDRFVEAEVTSTPGPGEYDPERANRPSSGAGHASVFASTVTATRNTEDNVPGPGAYDIGVRKEEHNLPSAAFKSSSTRIPLQLSDTPAPGTYEVAQASETLLAHHGSTAAAVFRSRTLRKTDLVIHSEAPGPGKYSLTPRSPAPGKERRVPQFSHLHASKPKPKVAEDLPGPGWYDNDGTQTRTDSKPSAAFRSSTQREFSAVREGPGPASYSMSDAAKAKASFLVNRNQKWL